ncbi:MAG: phosphotyrosine protein phosphatase [Nanoarchaeota archaeon]|nr:phosphotyrosine protein phosphatase [Nanoarchaeota archaeon]
MMKVLFVCNQGENRSRTAKELFKDRFETSSAGLYSEKPITERKLNWADVIVVMEDAQRSEIAKRFPEQYLKKKILSLDIPDVFNYNNPKLKHLLKLKIPKLL